MELRRAPLPDWRTMRNVERQRLRRKRGPTGRRYVNVDKAFTGIPLSSRRRVVITGIGAVTPVGISRAGLWNGIQVQRSAVAEVTRFDASMCRTRIAAEIRDFAPGDFMEAKKAKRLD